MTGWMGIDRLMRGNDERGGAGVTGWMGIDRLMRGSDGLFIFVFPAKAGNQRAQG